MTEVRAFYEALGVKLPAGAGPWVKVANQEAAGDLP
jgi:hypothetical protein